MGKKLNQEPQCKIKVNSLTVISRHACHWRDEPCTPSIGKEYWHRLHKNPIFRKRDLWNGTNLFIANMAISDLAICLTAVPLTPISAFSGGFSKSYWNLILFKNAKFYEMWRIFLYFFHNTTYFFVKNSQLNIVGIALFLMPKSSKVNISCSYFTGSIVRNLN